jgi:predicted RNase H-like HicB family nuclease
MPLLASVKLSHSVIEPDKDGAFVAECPVQAGCASQSNARSEIAASIEHVIIEAQV